MLERHDWRRRSLVFFLIAVAFAGPLGCTSTKSTEQASRVPTEPYCTPTFSAQSDDFRGLAIYESRVGGNGAPTDSAAVVAVQSPMASAPRTYSIEIDGKTYTTQSSLAGSQGQVDVVTKLKDLITRDSGSGLAAYGTSSLSIATPNRLGTPSIGALVGLTIETSHPNPKPIRFVEVALLNSDGQVAACTETSASGEFRFPSDKMLSGSIVEVRSRAYNGMNSAYVLDSPNTNRFHSIRKEIRSIDSDPVLFRARVRDDLKAGAFHILDQIFKAQNFLRLATADCDLPSSPTFFSGCSPFTSAPLVTVYWSPGVTPGVYFGSEQSISYYLNGKRELYILGGASGNVISSDMDQFDDSVIIHEYAHFIEDVFGRPNSPGGSHDGNSIIDPRLAWGEGWADYFQAAATESPVYRDTYGTPDCTAACAGVFFNTPIDPSGTPLNDAPTPASIAEGNFREFSISRLLWDVSKPAGVSQFSEIWRLFVEPSLGMRAVGDPFQSIGSIHALQSLLPGATDWSALLQIEEQNRGRASYGEKLLSDPNCEVQSITITPNKSSSNGEPNGSDLLRNNDFFRFDHSGGPLAIEVQYEKDPARPLDLDLYVYRSRYVFGRADDIVAVSALVNDGGTEKVSASAPPGLYMVNIFADTSNLAGTSTRYVLKSNGVTLCPSVTPL